MNSLRVCAVVPAYKVIKHICQVIDGLRPFVEHVFVVDDACPDGSGEYLRASSSFDVKFVSILILPVNQGVGGAVLAGYEAALKQGFDILVKVDGDGQMDPTFIPSLVFPIESGEADYTKGNRFFDPEMLTQMPVVRLIGNAGLSLVTKLSTGYWHIMDPTNGFTAIHAKLIPWIHPEKIEKRYFFESDVLYRLGLIGGVIQDVPMPARYGDEVSNLSIRNALFNFGGLHVIRLAKRIFYNYFLRGFSIGSLFLLLSIPMICFGVGYGIVEWHRSIVTGVFASTGKIMISVMPTLIGVQMLLSFLNLDMSKPVSKPFWVRVSNPKLKITATKGRDNI